MLSRIPKVSLYALTIIALAMIAMVRSSLVDPDFFWHLKAGQWMVENGKIPVNDPFLWTQVSTPWMNHEWLSDVLLFVIYRLGGGALVSVFVGVMFGLTLTLVYRFALLKMPPFLATLLTCFVGAVVLPWEDCRPQVITYLLFTVFLLSLLRYQQDQKRARLWILPPLLILWANLHGAFIIGIVLIGMFASLMTLEILWNTGFGSWRQCARKVSAIWGCFLVAIIAACLTPYGPHLLLHPFKVVTLWIVPYIMEWKPAAFGRLASAPLFFMIGVWLIVQIFRVKRPSPFELAIPLVFIGLSLSQIRQAPLAAIVMGATIAPQLNEVWSRVQAVFKSKMGSNVFVNKATQDLGPIQYLVNGLLVITGAVLVAVLLQGKQERQLKETGHVVGASAIDALAKAPQRGPIFNDYGYGGYLTWRLWPKQQAFIDGRSDMYSEQFAKDYIEISYGQPNWKSRFDHYKFNTVVTSRQGPLRQLLLLEGAFHEYFSDEDVTVLLRKIPIQ